MVDFEYYNPAKIVFGENSIDKIGELLKENHATKLLMVYSGEFIKELGIYEKVKEACESQGIEFYENGNVVPNPSIELVRSLVSEGKTNGIFQIESKGMTEYAKQLKVKNIDELSA